MCTTNTKLLSLIFIMYGITSHFFTFTFFNAIFICPAYPFTLLECLKSSSLSSLRLKFRTIQTYLNLILYISMLLLYANHFWIYEIVLKLRRRREPGTRDIEENPGPKPSSNQSFSICHWNLNSISAHNYMKISRLRAYISTQKFEVICISETFENHPSNTKRGGVCIYCKHSLEFRLLNIYYLKERINPEISFGVKICNFMSLYRSPSQSSD